MKPRWGDWIALMATLCAGALWVAAGLPGLPDQYNPLLWQRLAPVAITAVAPVLPPAPTVPPAPPPIGHPVVAAPVPAPAAPRTEPIVVAAAPPPAPSPPAKPPMPEVIRPSGGASLEGTSQAAVTVSQLPVVIRPSDQSQPTGTAGTGFFIAHDGSVMTVAHVVQSCKRIVVASRHVKETTARLLAMDVRNDVAVLLANNTRPPAVLALANRSYGSESLEIFGYPADGDKLIPTETHGLLRADRPTFNGLDRLDRPDVLWMDANTVRPGFSGGPIVDPNGDAIGLVNGHVMRQTLRGNVVVRDTKFVYGSSTRTINDFLSQAVPLLLPDAGRSPPPGETDKAIVRVLCLR